MKLTFFLNGAEREVEIAPTEILLEVLREKLRVTSIKRGCENGECGACIVLMDGRPVNSCLCLAVRAQGKCLTTVEGLGSPASLDVLQQCFVECGAFQCGFCASGVILVSKALLEENPDPSEQEIRRYIEGNLCRCTGYVKIIEAIQLAAKRLKPGGRV